MARVGLVGGLGPESTIDYYRRILARWAELFPDTMPSVLIDSLDVQYALRVVATDRPALISYLADSVKRLASGGSDFVAMTANTAHIVFDEVAAGSPVPLVSIVEVCADAAAARGLKRLALLGTRFTMEAPFYPDVFARRGMEVFPPKADDRTWVHARYVGQLLKGIFLDDTREEIVSLLARLKEEHHLDGIILGGTELPLLLKNDVIVGLPTLDTTELHVQSIVQRLKGA